LLIQGNEKRFDYHKDIDKKQRPFKDSGITRTKDTKSVYCIDFRGLFENTADPGKQQRQINPTFRLFSCLCRMDKKADKNSFNFP